MALRRPNPVAIATAAVAFLATVAVLTLLNGSPSLPAAGGSPAAGRSSAERIRALEAEVRRRPERTAAYDLLGVAYLQRARETGDSAFHGRAERAFELAAGD